MKKFLLLTLLMVSTLTGWAYDVEVDGIYYNLVSKAKTAEVTSGSPLYKGSVEIPASIIVDGMEYSVTSIGSSAFKDCSGLTSVTIPNSVTSIGSSAFDGCSGLVSVTIPNSVTSIGSNAFWGCSGLTSVTIPNSVTSIGDYAFSYCSGLTSMTIPNSVTSIGWGAFYDCSGLTSVTIPNSVTSIGDYAFYNCSGLTSVTNLSATPQKIGSSTFSTYGTLHVLPGCKAAYESADYWKEFSIIVEDAVDPTRTIEIEDGMAFTNSKAYFVDNLTYTRTFNNTDWQPLYIPFSMEYKDWASQGLEVAYINGFYEYDDDKNGTVDRSALEVIMVTEGEGRLIPNYPYLVRSKETGSKVLTLDNAELHPAEANSIDCSTVRTRYIFTGTYASVSQAELNAREAYIMGGGKLTPSAGALRPMRWYMQRESRGNQLLPLLSEIKVYVRGEEDEADALDFANEEKEAGQAYNLMGQKVSRDAKGIRIINGRKYVR